MDFKKLILDITTGNTDDLRKRLKIFGSRSRRVFYHLLHREMNNESLRKIPVLINNRNRITYLRGLIEWLEKNGMSNIIIIDNDSTYPELLNYYSSCGLQVIKLNRNAGPRAIWESDETKPFLKGFYIYTDADVVPDHSASFESIRLMYDTLRRFLFIDKVGFSLRIDNLPDHFQLKNEVITWEGKFWHEPVDELLFKAPVDTTFALYAPFASGGGECKAMRTNFPHVALHMPWYEDTNYPTHENEYYRLHSDSANSHWTRQTGRK